jgi:hypothetical protein
MVTNWVRALTTVRQDGTPAKFFGRRPSLDGEMVF